jgi:hypothetical protein
MVNLDYIASASANGDDADGNPITGFKFWDFAYPTLVTSGTGAIGDFITTTNGAVNFGGLVGSVSAWGSPLRAGRILRMQRVVGAVDGAPADSDAAGHCLDNLR